MKLKIKLLLSNEEWLWTITAYRSPTGDHYVTLANGEGHSVHGSAIIGGFPSLDWIVLNAGEIYLQLVEKLNVNLHRQSQPTRPAGV